MNINNYVCICLSILFFNHITYYFIINGGNKLTGFNIYLECCFKQCLQGSI